MPSVPPQPESTEHHNIVKEAGTVFAGFGVMLVTIVTIVVVFLNEK